MEQENRTTQQLARLFSSEFDGCCTIKPEPEDQYNSLENGMTQQSDQTFLAKYDNVLHVLDYKLIDHEDNKVKVKAYYERIFPVEGGFATKKFVVHTDFVPIINQLFQDCMKSNMDDIKESLTLQTALNTGSVIQALI